MTESEASALVELGLYLKREQYGFTAITPESHQRVVARVKDQSSKNGAGKSSVGGFYEQWSRDLFGWSLNVHKSLIPQEVALLLQAAGAWRESGSLVKSSVRFSTVGELLFVHSAFPTTEADAVFFGPDSYRFVRFLINKAKPANTIIDLGAGSGVGGLSLAQSFERRFATKVGKIYLVDINEKALNYSKINSAINGFDAAIAINSDLLQGVPKGAGLIIANPPFMIDELSRIYRHGGGNYGTQLSYEIANSALDYLEAEGGQLLLYTAAPIVGGRDIFKESLQNILSCKDAEFTYEEIDPDLYGEELSKPAYADVERLAGIGLSVTMNT